MRLTWRGQVVASAAVVLVLIGAASGVDTVADAGAPAPRVLVASPAAKAVVVQAIAGEATWYGPGMEGGTTASGEPFDQHVVAAAHPDLPFGTRVRVSRPDGRSVHVEVNDRLPDAGPSRIDLTRAAFQRIADLDEGRIPVTLEVLAAPASPSRPGAQPAASGAGAGS